MVKEVEAVEEMEVMEEVIYDRIWLRSMDETTSCAFFVEVCTPKKVDESLSELL